MSTEPGINTEHNQMWSPAPKKLPKRELGREPKELECKLGIGVAQIGHCVVPRVAVSNPRHNSKTSKKRLRENVF